MRSARSWPATVCQVGWPSALCSCVGFNRRSSWVAPQPRLLAASAPAGARLLRHHCGQQSLLQAIQDLRAARPPARSAHLRLRPALLPAGARPLPPPLSPPLPLHWAPLSRRPGDPASLALPPPAAAWSLPPPERVRGGQAILRRLPEPPPLAAPTQDAPSSCCCWHQQRRRRRRGGSCKRPRPFR